MDEETMNTIPKSEIEGLKARISGLYAQNKRLNRECVDSEVLNAVLRKEIAGLKAQLQTSKENCLTLLDTNKKLEAENALNKVGASEWQHRENERLKDANASLRRNNEKLEAEIRDLKGNLRESENGFASLMSANRKLRAKLEAAEEKKESKELSEEEWLSGHPGYILFPASSYSEIGEKPGDS